MHAGGLANEPAPKNVHDRPTTVSKGGLKGYNALFLNDGSSGNWPLPQKNTGLLRANQGELLSAKRFGYAPSLLFKQNMSSGAISVMFIPAETMNLQLRIGLG